MKVTVTNLYTDKTVEIVGSPTEVARQLIERYPWLHTGQSKHAGNVEFLVRSLNTRAQALDAELESDPSDLNKSEGNLQDDLDAASEIALDMIGFNPRVHPAFSAAQFLSGKPEVSLSAIRQALYDHEDYIDAALSVYGLPIDDESRKALRSVMGLGSLDKAEPGDQVPAGNDIEPGTPDAMTAVEALQRAWKLKQVRVAHLDGKHSKGSLIARDGVTDRTYLLKPGSNGAGSAAGAAEQPASPSRREAAFWQIAEDWGIGESIPRADLVIIDGKEYAAIEMLPFTWKGMQKKLGTDPGVGRQVLSTYRDRGLLHKWAVMDFVLGNPDRHEDNMMISEDNKLVGLIDHGSAFAGPGFDPGFDQRSFVPFYLRAWAGPKFNRMSVREKLERMPSANGQLRDDLRDWLNGIHADHLEMMLNRFGIDPRPTMDRLAKVKVAASEKPVDEAINRLWVTT